MHLSDNSRVSARAGSCLADKAVVGLFVGFIALFLLLFVLLKRHEGELSGNERRVLASAPDITIGKLLSGVAFSELDTWLEDHFPMRSGFVALHSYSSRLFGTNSVEDIVLGRNGRLFSAPTAKNDTIISKNIRIINDFSASNSLNSYLMLIPSSGHMLHSELPALSRKYYDGSIISTIRMGLSGFNFVDVEECFSSSSDTGSLFFKTDHHLTMDGSYLAYRLIANALGHTPVDEGEFTKQEFNFFGTAYGSSGLLFTKPDRLEVWTREEDSQIAVTTVDGAITNEHQGMIDYASLEPDFVDKYSAFLYGNHGYTSIVNPNVSSGVLLVLKDSYANAIVPFLAAHYREIIMIDVRYYNTVMIEPGKLVEQLGIDDFVVIYGVSTFATTNDMPWLRN